MSVGRCVDLLLAAGILGCLVVIYHGYVELLRNEQPGKWTVISLLSVHERDEHINTSEKEEEIDTIRQIAFETGEKDSSTPGMMFSLSVNACAVLGCDCKLGKMRGWMGSQQ